jgi:hypothetical protein
MGNPFKKVQSGQKLEIPAEAFNTFIDAALDFKARQRNQGQSAQPGQRSSTILKVRNDSGEARLRFEVLGLAEPIISPELNEQAFQNEPTFTGVTPQDPDHRGRFAILLEPVEADQIAAACVEGVTVALVHVLDPEHQYADIARDTCEHLESCEVGAASILWKLADEGVTWALVRLGNVEEAICRFRLTEKLDRCGSAAAERIVSTQSDEYGPRQWCESDREIEVVDALGVIPPEGLLPGAFGWAKWMPDSRSWEVLYYGEGCCGFSSGSPSSESSPSSGSSLSESSGSPSSGSSLSESSISGSSRPSESSVSGSPSSQASESSAPSESAPSESGPPPSVPSESPSSASAPSESAPSESGPPSSAPSESAPRPSSAPSESAPPPSSAPSESAPPPSTPSESAPPPSTPSWGSDKSTAIVPASWTPGGYTALFTLESPEVLFEDILLARIPQKAATLKIDPRFVEVCEPRSIVVSGCVPDVPAVVGVSVEGGLIRVRFAVEDEQEVKLVLRLTGVRRGFAGLRFPNRSRRQFEANEAFIHSAYPAE